MAHVLFDEGLVDLGHLAEHTNGVDDVRQIAAHWPPERVAEACGIDAADIRRLARELSAAPTAAVYARIGTCTQEFGTLAGWLVDVLTGNLDRAWRGAVPPGHMRPTQLQGESRHTPDHRMGPLAHPGAGCPRGDGAAPGSVFGRGDRHSG